MKILVIATFPTHPATAGNRAWILGQVETLKALGHDVHYLFVLHPSFRAVSEEAQTATSHYWGERYHEYALSVLDKLCIKAGAVISRLQHCSITCDEKYPCGLSCYVDKLQKQESFDLCIVNYFFLTKLFDKVKFPKTALSTHDSFSYRDLLTGDKGTMSLTPNEEAKAMQRCNYIFALQEEEKNYFAHLSPNSKVLNVYGRFEYQDTPVTANHNLLFLGSGINYNTSALRHFITDIFPHIRAKYNDAQLLIGGSVCNTLADLGTREGVVLKGFVDQPIDLYRMGDVAINPVSQGTGLKIKTFESIAYGKLTLVHPHSMKGIFAPEKSPLYVATTAEDWVRHLDILWSKAPETLAEEKKRNQDYLKAMNDYITSQYLEINA